MQSSPPNPSTTQARYRALQQGADEGARGLLGLATRALGLPLGVVFLLGEGGDFASYLQVGDADPAPLKPLARFGLLHREPIVIEDLRASIELATEPAVFEGGQRTMAAVVVAAPTGEPLGVLCFFGPAPRPLREGDGGWLADVGRQLGGWLATSAELKRLAASHAAQIERLQMLEGLAKAGEGLALLATDEQGAIRWLNQGAALLLGREARALRGRRADAVLEPAVTGGEALVAWLRRGASGEREWRCLRASGVGVPVSASGAEVQDEEGQGKGFVLLLRDLTGKKHEEELRRELLANVNHELRTPLSVVLASLQMLDIGAHDEARELVTMATSAAERLGRLIDDILALQALEQGNTPMHVAHCDALQILEDTLDACQTLAAERGVEVQLRQAPYPVSLRADPVWVGRAMRGLLESAILQTDTGVVGVEMSQIDDHFLLVVSGGATQTSDPPGLRLGQSVARAVAERLGGSLGREPASQALRLELPTR